MAKKKRSGSSAPDKRAKKNDKHIPDDQIDFSDIPELSDEQLGEMKRFGRPLLGMSKRQLISLRIDPDILDKLKEHAKEQGKGYQSLINEILAKFVDKNVA